MAGAVLDLGLLASVDTPVRIQVFAGNSVGLDGSTHSARLSHDNMTSPEHTLVGIHCAFAVGLHRLCGWRAVVMAAVASNLPDWDGLPMLFDMQRFHAGHRAWGHGVLSLLLAALVLGWTQTRWDWIGKVADWSHRRLPNAMPNAPSRNPAWLVGIVGTLVFAGVALVAQALHLVCDMVVSGGYGLTDWAIQPFWPFSHASYVYPLVHWGDVGPTLILMAGIILAAKYPRHVPKISASTLVVLVGYMLVRS